MMGSFAYSTSALAYGAIAVDDEQGAGEPGYGFATGADTQPVAVKKALEMCGKKNCNVAIAECE